MVLWVLCQWVIGGAGGLGGIAMRGACFRPLTVLQMIGTVPKSGAVGWSARTSTEIRTKKKTGEPVFFIAADR
jgi:hypothetical protein